MAFSDLSDDILLEIAFCIKKRWRSFAAVNSRCRAAALSAQLAIRKKFITISDHESSTVKALEEPTKQLMNAIRKVNVTSGAMVETANEPKFGLNHLRSLFIGSTMLDALFFIGSNDKPIPLIAILNLLASLNLQTDTGRLTNAQCNPIRFLKLWEISYFEDCSDIPLTGLAGLEILHICWQRYSSWGISEERKPYKTTCEVLVKMIKAARNTLQSLKIDFLGDRSGILSKFDIRMLAGDEDDVGARKKLRKLRLSIFIHSGSPFRDFVGTLEAIADMFPNLETLDLITTARKYDDMIRYTPDILRPLSKLKFLHCLMLALDFERDINDELDKDHDVNWYNRCLHRRYAATQAIANVCPITRCYWKHQFIDSEGNDEWYHFVVENESKIGKPGDSSRSDKQTGNTMVKTKMPWWFESYWWHKVEGDLPGEVVGPAEKWEYTTSDPDYYEFPNPEP
ncbi:hypothetical protein K435DRAFT_845490 [Dendrothele bispora CBS 962.96]|uniref:F-box domain-containing protein n=1 Tax=Dendrothele bispora (strain CBS 962.96) TaxID=1314807 RepID=A0A4S8KV67_DENBC|nr:hypothetical protein K435DRAFT_845490 [Dendrothele bispora CBS 962.96]